MTPFIQIPAAFISPCSKCPESPNYQISQKNILPLQPFPTQQNHYTENLPVITEFEWKQEDGEHGGGWKEEREGKIT